MHHLPRLFTYNRKSSRADPRKAKLQRCNAVKYFDYDAESSSSSLESSLSQSLQTHSLDLSDRVSFRVDGNQGDLERICRKLGLSGPEDFAIPTEAWEARKLRSSSDPVVARLSNSVSNVSSEAGLARNESSELNEVGDGADLKLESPVELSKSSELGEIFGDEIRARGRINGIRPPALKPPSVLTLPVIDDAVSSWDILRDFAPASKIGPSDLARQGFSSCSEEGQVDGEAAEKEESEARILGDVVLLSGSCSFTTFSEDDSSSTTTEFMPSSVSPNGRFRRIITYWEKGDLLGRGSFGSVYEGISDDGFFFAVKEVSLLDQGSHGKQSVYQLEQEIALLSKFEHRNIVQYYGTDKDDAKLYIFLELVTKGSLASLYQTYRLRDSQVSAYTRQILDGLKYLHEQNVVHRDIKCANILVDANGSVKLADFGLAKAARFNGIKSCKGTAFWMAPEVVRARSQGYGPPADIWSLGCTVLEMLTGHFPYYPLECMQALYRIGKGQPPSVPENLSEDARDFIMQCLRVNPNDRPTAAELLNHPFVRRPLPAWPYMRSQDSVLLR